MTQRPGTNVRGLWAQGAAAGAPPLRGAGGQLVPGRGRARPRGLHLPAARLLRAGGRPRAFNRVLRQTVAVDPELARLYTEQLMADGPNKPNRPIRPRQGAPGRKRRVVIEGGGPRPRDMRQARNRSDAPKAPPREVVATDRSCDRPVGRLRPRPLAGARRPGRPDHQDHDGPRPDDPDHAVALRRGGRADRGRARPRDHDQARRRRGGAARGLRGRRGGPRAAAAGGHDHGPRRPRQDLAARRDPRDPWSSRPRPAGSRSTSAPTRSTSTGGRSPSSTRRATRRSRRCAPAAPR